MKKYVIRIDTNLCFLLLHRSIFDKILLTICKEIFHSSSTDFTPHFAKERNVEIGV